jgi:hypothetical protein
MNGGLRDECLNGEVFFDLAKAREKYWRHDYNYKRPHSGLADRTLEEFARTQRWDCGPSDLLNVNKAAPTPRQAFAVAGQKPPPLTRRHRRLPELTKGLSEGQSLLEKIN